MLLTASKLYDYLQCPHRVWRDLYGPQSEKNPETNPFVELLWEKGVSREKEVIDQIGPMLDLSSPNKSEHFTKTLEAMRSGEPLIYHGYLQWENLAGEPDLLRRNSDGTYTPIDIKSGRGVDGADEETGDPGKPKKHYAVQLALYCEILIALGFAKKHVGEIYDIDSKTIVYELDEKMGIRSALTWWQEYIRIKNEATLLLTNERKNDPALAGICKLCPWFVSCKKWCTERDDLTIQFNLGRSKRDTLQDEIGISSIAELESIDIPVLLDKKVHNKSFLPGFAEKSLRKIQQRARVLHSLKTPILYGPVAFPDTEYELYFDIEDDPTQGFVYLHGVYERHNGRKQFKAFVAKNNSSEAEKQAWSEFWEYIRSLPKDGFCLYYYSSHEPTTYKRMQQQYPDVVTPVELEWLFESSRSVDLYYDCITKNTDWPLYSYSLKEIAHYLGFNWRDKSPSGALSIEWFNEYLKDKDPKKLQRIIDYNEDDCKATLVIHDYLMTMKPSYI